MHNVSHEALHDSEGPLFELTLDILTHPEIQSHWTVEQVNLERTQRLNIYFVEVQRLQLKVIQLRNMLLHILANVIGNSLVRLDRDAEKVENIRVKAVYNVGGIHFPCKIFILICVHEKYGITIT